MSFTGYHTEGDKENGCAGWLSVYWLLTFVILGLTGSSSVPRMVSRGKIPTENSEYIF